MYQSTLYHDQLLRARVDVEDTPDNWQAIRDLKETLKARFEQLDMWVTAHRIEVISKQAAWNTPILIFASWCVSRALLSLLIRTDDLATIASGQRLVNPNLGTAPDKQDPSGIHVEAGWIARRRVERP
jgi:hypothetical protein